MFTIFDGLDDETVKYAMLGYIGGASGLTVTLAAAVAVPGVI